MSALKLLMTLFLVFAALFAIYPLTPLKKLPAEIGSYLSDNGILVLRVALCGERGLKSRQALIQGAYYLVALRGERV